MMIDLEKIKEKCNIYEGKIYADVLADDLNALISEFEILLTKLAEIETKVQPSPAVAVHNSYMLLAEKLITEVCCSAVEKLNEIAPAKGWDSGEVVAEMCIRRLRALLPTPTPPSAEPDIDEIVNRFLGWKLPKDFAPDCGISFNRESAFHRYEPIGTNLFTADQAKEMFKYALNYDRWPSTKEVIATIRDQQRNQFEQPDSAAVEPYGYVIGENFRKNIKGSTFNSGFTPVYLHQPAKPQRITEQDARQIIHSMVGYREHEQRIFETEFEYWIEEKGRTLLAKLNERREPDYKAQEIPEEWRVTKFGQIKVGDVLSLVCGDNHICTTAKEILNAGTKREEVIYNRKKNHYFITSMVLDGTSTHKHVFIVPNPAIAKASASTDSGVNNE